MSTQSQPHNPTPEWTIGDRLRKARTHAGMSQTELAQAIDVSPRSVGKYENGAPTRRHVRLAWALATGVPVEWLETGHGAPSSDPDTPRGQGNPSSGWITDMAAHRARRLSVAA